MKGSFHAVRWGQFWLTSAELHEGRWLCTSNRYMLSLFLILHSLILRTLTERELCLLQVLTLVLAIYTVDFQGECREEPPSLGLLPTFSPTSRCCYRRWPQMSSSLKPRESLPCILFRDAYNRFNITVSFSHNTGTLLTLRPWTLGHLAAPFSWFLFVLFWLSLRPQPPAWSHPSCLPALLSTADILAL